MRNVLKLKNIKTDIIEASISSHSGDNFLDLYVKTILMNKYKSLNLLSYYLMIPYLLWTVYALILNTSLLVLN